MSVLQRFGTYRCGTFAKFALLGAVAHPARQERILQGWEQKRRSPRPALSEIEGDGLT